MRFVIHSLLDGYVLCLLHVTLVLGCYSFHFPGQISEVFYMVCIPICLIKDQITNINFMGIGFYVAHDFWTPFSILYPINRHDSIHLVSLGNIRVLTELYLEFFIVC